jgi:hypothetical protein
MATALYTDVETMLAAHGAGGAMRPFAHEGYSGAALSYVEGGATRFVLKRIAGEPDWLRRALRDERCREARLAASPFAARLPEGVRSASIAACHDGEGYAVLMHDLTGVVPPPDGALPRPQVSLVLQRLAEMHAAFWEAGPGGIGCGPVPLEDWLRVLEPAHLRALAAEGIDFGGPRGWELFERLAHPDAVALVRALHADPSPLLAASAALPPTLLHGDAKVANMGIDGDTLWLFDWQTVMYEPVAHELSWFLAVNSSRLPDSLDATLETYAAHLRRAIGPRFDAAQWPRQVAVCAVAGLRTYGWGKALDADAGRPEELRWWCERALAGARALGW